MQVEPYLARGQLVILAGDETYAREGVFDPESRERNAFLDAVLESLTHPFYVLDARDHTIRMANSAAWWKALESIE